MAEEKNFEGRVKRWLRQNGCYVVKYYGCGTTRAGVPDLLICVNGKFLAVELKAEKGTTTPLQETQLKLIEKAGGTGLVLKPSGFMEFKRYIRELMK